MPMHILHIMVGMLVGLPFLGCTGLFILYLYEIRNGDAPFPSIGRLLAGFLQSWLSFLAVYLLYVLRPFFRLDPVPVAHADREPGSPGAASALGVASEPGEGTKLIAAPTPDTASGFGGAIEPAARVVTSQEGAALPVPSPGKAKPPVLLVHPTAHNAAAWLVYRYFLRKAGYTRLYYFEYSIRRDTFPRVAQKLAAAVDSLAEAHPGERPVLMGVSLGAALCRAATEHLGKETKLLGLITLACPHRGTRVAALAPHFMGLVRELAPSGSIPRALTAQGPPNFPCLSVSSPLDEVILPVQALRAPAGWREVITRPVSHMSILFHLPTIRLVLREIENLREAERSG